MDQQPPVVANGDKRLTIRSFKVVMDGALGSRTAWLHEPYTDDPSTAGVQTFDPATLVELFRQSKAHGWQINTHAIGDKANSVVLTLSLTQSWATPIIDRVSNIHSIYYQKMCSALPIWV